MRFYDQSCNGRHRTRLKMDSGGILYESDSWIYWFGEYGFRHYFWYYFSKMEEISLLAYDIKQANYETLSRKGVQVCQQLEQVAKADYIVLAVKPQNIAEVMENLKPIINQDAVIVSIAAGITESYLCQALGYEAKVVLVMPNTPLLLGAGGNCHEPRVTIPATRNLSLYASYSP